LRLFGSKIGCNVIIKPFVKIKYPWKLQIGDYSWIGEEVWIDNIFNVKIGDNTCISQGVYICSANHHFGKINFELLRGEVTIGNSCWISAKCVIGPNVNISDNSFVKLGEKLTTQFQ
jgi:putative colanic acid biosynthesis acetyltransferase WcaF